MLLHIKVPETEIRDIKLILIRRGQSSGDWSRCGAAGGPVRSGGATSALGDVNWAGNGGPESPSSNLVNILIIKTLMMVMIMMIRTATGVVSNPFPFEEKESTSPPFLLLSLLGFLGIVLRDRLLKLEVYGVNGS